MGETEYCYEPIGKIHSPFEDVEGMPIQPSGGDAVGEVELTPDYAAGLDDLEEFSHCILIYHFHRAADGSSMHVQPFLDNEQRGLFSTRAPVDRIRSGSRWLPSSVVTGPRYQFGASTSSTARRYWI